MNKTPRTAAEAEDARTIALYYDTKGKDEVVEVEVVPASFSRKLELETEYYKNLYLDAKDLLNEARKQVNSSPYWEARPISPDWDGWGERHAGSFGD